MNNSRSNGQTMPSTYREPKYTREQVANRVRKVKQFAGAAVVTVGLGGLGYLAFTAKDGPSKAQETAAVKSIDSIDTAGVLTLAAGVNERSTPNNLTPDDQDGGPSNIVGVTKEPLEIPEALTSSQYPGWDAFKSGKNIVWVNTAELQVQDKARYQTGEQPYGSDPVAHVSENGQISVAPNEYVEPAVDTNAGVARIDRNYQNVSF